VQYAGLTWYDVVVGLGQDAETGPGSRSDNSESGCFEILLCPCCVSSCCSTSIPLTRCSPTLFRLIHRGLSFFQVRLTTKHVVTWCLSNQFTWYIISELSAAHHSRPHHASHDTNTGAHVHGLDQETDVPCHCVSPLAILFDRSWSSTQRMSTSAGIL
jgi:hypothetical protein